MKYIEIDRHARRRMKWRKITEEEIIESIVSPDYSEPSLNRRINVYKDFNGRVVKVTYKEETEEKLLVISAVIKKNIKGDEYEN